MFSTPNTNSKNVTYNFEDFGYSEINEAMVGRKGESLFRLHSFDVPVPEFFVISPEVFSEFTNRVFKEKGKEILKDNNAEYREILGAFNKYDFEETVKNEILHEYTRISGFTDTWVAVRASVAFPQSPKTSFTGVFSTLLNIRGGNNLLRAIKEVYASFFTDSAVMYAMKEGIELSDVKLAIVVQKMVHAEVSGVCFTLDPVTQDPTKMSVEAVFGLGDVISNGEITPDTYHLNKRNLEIYEKHIAPQEWMKVRNVSDSKLGGFEKVQISPAWSHRQKLEDKNVAEVSKIALIIEEKTGDHQDVEWVIGGGRVWILQIKRTFDNNVLPHHIQYGGYSYVSNTVAEVIKSVLNKDEMSQKALSEATKYVEQKSQKVEKKEEPKVESKPVGVDAIFSAIGASFGQVKGNAMVADVPLTEVKRNDILVIKDFDRSISDLIFKSGGVVCESGGVTSDLAILCRELGIPAVVGAVGATTTLHTGDTLQIDGNTGAVYRLNEVQMQQAQVVTEIIEKLQEQEEEVVEEPVVEEKVIPSSVEKVELPKTATKVFASRQGKITITSGVVSSDGVALIDLDKLMIAEGRHPAAFLKEGKYKEYGEKISKIISEIANAVDPKEVILLLGKAKVKKFKELTKGADFESKELADDTYGVTRYMANLKALEVALRIVKRVRNINHNRNVSLAVYGPSNGAIMKDIKKEVSASGLRRTSTFNLYAVIENPAEIILAEDILSSDIDGIILDTPMVARYVFNLPKESKNVVYDLGSGSILKIVDALSSSVRMMQRKIYVVCEKNKDLIKHCISKGSHGIIVEEDFIPEAKQLVADEEARLILSIK